MSAKAKNKLTPQQRKATLNRVLHKIRPYSAFVVCSLLVAAVSVAAQLYIPILCGDAIDKMLGKGNVDFAGVLRIAVSILVVAAVAALAQWLLSVCKMCIRDRELVVPRSMPITLLILFPLFLVRRVCGLIFLQSILPDGCDHFLVQL